MVNISFDQNAKRGRYGPLLLYTYIYRRTYTVYREILFWKLYQPGKNEFTITTAFLFSSILLRTPGTRFLVFFANPCAVIH